MLRKKTLIEILFIIVLVTLMLWMGTGCSQYVSDPTRPDIAKKAKKEQKLRLDSYETP